MVNPELDFTSTYIDELEKRISKLEEKVKDQYLLINDRIDEAFFIIRELDRKQIKDAE
tara:strand:- start:341 stop:514 length:174 start_codon:yes stop_codon:yes gene_type:complete